MSRTSDTALTGALAASAVMHFVLIELQLDSGIQRLASTPFDVEWDGHDWLAAQGIGTIEPITETSGQSTGLAFTLFGAGAESIAGALTEPVQGRKCILRVAVVDGETLRVDPNTWVGYLDVMTVDDQATGPVIRVTAEHAMLAWNRPSGVMFSHTEQLKRDPTDLFFEYGAAMSETSLTWPDAVFFKQ